MTEGEQGTELMCTPVFVCSACCVGFTNDSKEACMLLLYSVKVESQLGKFWC